MLVIVDDGPVRRHLAEAVARHCVQLRRDGHLVPGELTALLTALSASGEVSRGQPRTALDDARGRLLTYGQAARLLGVSPRTVRRRVADGTFRPVRVGRSPRLVADELLGARNG